MTKKQSQIIAAGLELFANEGYNATSTSKVAKKANVSEGLIFRHFKNKQGLVNAILKEGDLLLNELFTPIINEKEPKKTIKKALEMLFNINKEGLVYWKLQFKLKWELDYFDRAKAKPLEEALNNAFIKLKYKEPQLETDFVLYLLDGIATAIIAGHMVNEEKFKALLLKKYHIE